jgi:2-dehydropantoate 2-reductase
MLALNCMVNPVAGLSGLGPTDVRLEPGPRRLSIALPAEAINVGRTRGFEGEPIWGIAAQRIVDAATGRGLAEVEADIARDAKSRSGGGPSLLQDVMRGRRTEIDYLNGYVVDEARRLGVPVPFNEAIVEIYRRHGVGALKPDPRNLDPLLEKLR